LEKVSHIRSDTVNFFQGLCAQEMEAGGRLLLRSSGSNQDTANFPRRWTDRRPCATLRQPMSQTAATAITADSPMRDVLAAYPGAQRSLFRRYHIGGCSSCGFAPEETLAGVCARNGGLDAVEVLAHIESSHEQAALLKADPALRLVDVRSREEFEAVRIAGSVLLSQEVMRGIMADGSNTTPLVIIDHQGKNALDAAAYFMGHGLQNVRCLRGGIDAWAQEVDPALRRYRVG